MRFIEIPFHFDLSAVAAGEIHSSRDLSLRDRLQPALTQPVDKLTLSWRDARSPREREPSPMNSPDLALFAAELRELRLSAGLSCRALAARAHFSRTTVSNVENGVRRPSLDIVMAFVRACGGDVRAAEEKWRRLPPADGLTPAIPGTPGAAASPWDAQPATDGADPDQAGCSADAITVAARRIALANQRRVIGQIELRFSRSRKAAWGRFSGFGTLDRLADRHGRVDVAVEAVRESDGRRTRYENEYSFDVQWGPLLLVDSGPLFARAEVIIDGTSVAENCTEARILR